MIKRVDELTPIEEELFNIAIELSPDHVTEETVKDFIISTTKSMTIYYAINYTLDNGSKVQGKHFFRENLKKELRERKLNEILSIK